MCFAAQFTTHRTRRMSLRRSRGGIGKCTGAAMCSDTALLVIDVQNGMFAEDHPVYQGAGLLATIGDLRPKARAAQVPVIYIQHNGDLGHLLEPGGAGWPIHPAIAPAEGEPVIGKATPDAFHET